jgi:hypothetical protein
MSSLNDLRNEARSHLLLQAQITQKQGTDLDIGEEFSVRFTVTNSFSGSEGEFPGHAHFRGVILRLTGTPYARPVERNELEIPMTDHLGYQNSVSRTVRFKALAKFPLIFGIDIPEPYVNARVDADFDIVRFFHCVQETSFLTQIDDG